MSNQSLARLPAVIQRLRQPVGVAAASRSAVGGVPQVSLLPAEVREAGSVARHRRRLVVAVVAVAAVAVGGVAVAANVNAAAESRLAAAGARTVELNAQVAKFSELRALEQEIALGRAAVKVGGSTVVDWNAQVSDILTEMPSGYTVTSISASGATPLADYPQGATPLEPRRAATVVMTITSTGIGDEYSAWLRRLRTIPAYADANASVVTNDGTSTITLTTHLSPAAIVATKPTE